MNLINTNTGYQYQYRLSDGRILLSQTDLHHIVHEGFPVEDLSKLELKDTCILPNEQMAHLFQCLANGGAWAKNLEESTGDSFEQNFCIQSGSAIYLNTGKYTQLEEVLKCNNKDALKIIIGRLARQAALAQAYCACLQHSAEAGGICE